MLFHQQQLGVFLITHCRLEVLHLRLHLHQLGRVTDPAAHQFPLTRPQARPPALDLTLALPQPEVHVSPGCLSHGMLSLQALSFDIVHQHGLDPRDLATDVTGALVEALVVKSQLRSVHTV